MATETLNENFQQSKHHFARLNEDGQLEEVSGEEYLELLLEEESECYRAHSVLPPHAEKLLAKILNEIRPADAGNAGYVLLQWIDGGKLADKVGLAEITSARSCRVVALH